MSEDRIDVTRWLPVSAQTVFEILCEPDGHVQIDSAGMLMSAAGDRVAGVGDRFVVEMDREALNDYPLGEYQVEVEITGFERDRWIEWKINSVLDPPVGHRYGYTIGSDTDDRGRIAVTSYCDWSQMHPKWRAGLPMPVVPESSLRATLGILDRVARQRARHA